MLQHFWRFMMGKRVWLHHPTSIGSLKVAVFFSNYCKFRAFWCETTPLSDITLFWKIYAQKLLQNGLKNDQNGNKNHQTDTNPKKCLFCFFLSLQFVFQVKWSNMGSCHNTLHPSSIGGWLGCGVEERLSQKESLTFWQNARKRSVFGKTHPKTGTAYKSKNI